MKTLSTFVITLALATAFAQEENCKCKAMEGFSVKATDGKTYTKDTLCAKNTIVVFLSAGCPHNPKAAPDFNKLSAQLGKDVRLVGVTNLDVAKAKKYASELKLNFPLLADADKAIISSFGAKHSLDLALVCAKDKKVANVTEGYSKGIVEEIIASLPHHGGPKLKLNLSTFPATKKSGCSL